MPYTYVSSEYQPARNHLLTVVRRPVPRWVKYAGNWKPQSASPGHTVATLVAE